MHDYTIKSLPTSVVVLEIGLGVKTTSEGLCLILNTEAFFLRMDGLWIFHKDQSRLSNSIAMTANIIK